MLTVMTERHLDQVLELESELFSSPWSRDAFLYEIKENPYSLNYVAGENEQIIGYCGLWCLFDQAQITNVAVAKKAQRQGLGKRMLEYMEEKAIEQGCETLSLEVRISNLPAIALYKKMGFETINIRKGYYQDNHEDAYFMMKAIGGSQYE